MTGGIAAMTEWGGTCCTLSTGRGIVDNLFLSEATIGLLIDWLLHMRHHLVC